MKPRVAGGEAGQPDVERERFPEFFGGFVEHANGVAGGEHGHGFPAESRRRPTTSPVIPKRSWSPSGARYRVAALVFVILSPPESVAFR